MSYIKKLTSVGILMALTFFLGQNMVFAQDSGQKNTEVIASVSIIDASIGQNDRTAVIKFSLSNYGSAISGIKTNIVLYSKDLSTIFDQRIIDGSVSLDKGETKEVIWTYKIPDSLSGTYKLVLKAQTSSSLPLATLVFPNNLVTKTPAKGLYLDPASCFLTVSGEPATKKYKLEEGVDVLPTEKLNLSCSVKNNEKIAVEVKTSFENYLRSIAGGLISKTLSADGLKFAASETKKVDFPIALPTEPQAYDTFVGFEKIGISLSNKIRAHFVVRGESATIQNFSLDKTSYKAGDTAQITLNWTPSADSFPDSRIGKGTALTNPQVTISLFSLKESCAKDVTIPLAGDSFKATGSINVEKDCPYVIAKVSITNDGKSLYTSEYNVLPKKENNFISNIQDNYMSVVALSSFIVVLLLFVKLISKRKKVGPMMMLLILIGFGLTGFKSASADTVTWKDKGNNTLTGTINMSRTWDVGDNVNFSGDFSNTYQWCTNGAKRTVTLGYEVINSAGTRVSIAQSLIGPMINQDIGPLAAGNYILKTYFGDSADYVLTGYKASMCPSMRTEYIYQDYGPPIVIEVPDGQLYSCQIPVYTVGAIHGMASLEIPFVVKAGSLPPDGGLSCTGDTDVYAWSVSYGSCSYSFSRMSPNVQCNYSPDRFLECASNTVTPVCKRSSDGQTVADSFCAAATKPASTSGTCSCRCES